MDNSETNGHGTRVVPAPTAGNPLLHPTILDVVCSQDEEVEWHWTMTDRGAVVSGYSIIPRSGTCP